MNLKLQKAEEKLLDLGKSNKLINFTISDRYLKIYSPTIFSSYQIVCSNKKVSIFDFDKFSEQFSPNQNKKKDFLETNSFSSSQIQFRKSLIDKISLSDNELLIMTDSFSTSLKKAIKNIDNTNLDAINERGINLLYICFGLLRYKDSDSNSFYQAPIILIPCQFSYEGKFETYLNPNLDEASLNSTLCYKLKHEYNINFPTYKPNDNLEKYFKKLEKEISKQDDWSIIYSSYIGLFTFSKIDIYNDLKEHEDIVLSSSLINTLFGEEKLKQNNLIDNIDLEDKQNQLHNIVSADSSQMKAILDAKNGNSFVLIGPPGTGKSQTITNIIAELIYQGKKVLFVSEKISALDVVYTKLKENGLGDFCLKLHGLNSNKQLVLTDLVNCLQISRNLVDLNRTNKLDEDKNKLNEYVNSLHQIQPIINLSSYEIFAKAIYYKQFSNLGFAFDDISNKGQDYLEKASVNLEKILSTNSIVNYDLSKSPLYGYKYQNHSYEKLTELTLSVNKCLSISKNLAKLQKLLYENFGYKHVNYKNIFNILTYLDTLKDLPLYEHSFFLTNSANNLVALLTYLNEYGNNIDEITSSTLINYTSDVLIDKLEDISKRMQTYSGFARHFKSNYHKDYKFLKSHYVGKDKYNLEIAKKDSLLLAKLYLSKVKFDDVFNQISNLVYPSKSLTKQNYKSYCEYGIKLLSDIDLIPPKGFNWNYDDLLTHQKQIFNNLFNYEKELKDLSKLASYFEEASSLYTIEFTKLNSILSSISSSLTNIEYYINMANYLNQANKDGYLNYINLFFKSKIDKKQIVNTFKKIFFTQWADKLKRDTPIFNSLNRIAHENIISSFQKEDQLNLKANQEEIKDKLLTKILNSNSQLANQLIQESNRKRNSLSVRKIIDQYKDIIFDIKPCLMMSPLTVSSFLDAKIKFDTVIFDEASQIFPWDALTSIYRGKQAIVVGDPKQMPPTSFFISETNYDENDSEVYASDFESILDYCSILPQRYLLWHYRSLSEDLIQFSNRHFYDNKLISFPSSHSKQDGYGIDFIYVKNATYTRGKGINYLEANKVVDLIFENIERYHNRSLGVIAFNINQQELINDILEERLLANQKYQSFFSKDRFEPFFIKNLETSQGDERDTIILSIGYGKDENDKFYNSFGPLNRDGGERRLNVAITRAKINIQVVSSILSNDIKITNNTKNGPKLLKAYLEYAQNSNTTNYLYSNKPTFDSDYEEDVYNFLTANNYKVDTKLGCSSYKLDLAIKDNNNKYILGIESDGLTYKNNLTATDRDHLRPQILKSKGWNIYHLWEVDWLYNTKKEKDNLVKLIEKLLSSIDNNSNKRSSSLASNKIEEIKSTSNISNKSDVLNESKSKNVIEANKTPLQVKKDDNNLVNSKSNLEFDKLDTKKTKQEQVNLFEDYFDDNSISNSKDNSDYNFQSYIFANPIKFKSTNNQGQDVLTAINNIIKIEQPINQKFLERRLKDYLKLNRITSTYSSYIFYSIRILENKYNLKKIKDAYLFDESKIKFRINSNRKLDEIPTIELEECIYQLVKQAKNINKDNLIEKVYKLVNISYPSLVDKNCILSIIDSLVKDNKLNFVNDTYSVN